MTFIEDVIHVCKSRYYINLSTKPIFGLIIDTAKKRVKQMFTISFHQSVVFTASTATSWLFTISTIKETDHVSLICTIRNFL